MSNGLNGGVILPNNAQREMAFAQMRLQVAASIIGHIAAYDFHRAYAAAVKAADPHDTYNAEESGPLNLSININGPMVAEAACAYAESLLAMHGITKPAEQQKTEWEKAVN